MAAAEHRPGARRRPRREQVRWLALPPSQPPVETRECPAPHPSTFHARHPLATHPASFALAVRVVLAVCGSPSRRSTFPAMLPAAACSLLQRFAPNLSSSFSCYSPTPPLPALLSRLMQSSDSRVYAAGDAASCSWAAAESAHWFQMRLWSQVGCTWGPSIRLPGCVGGARRVIPHAAVAANGLPVAWEGWAGSVCGWCVAA